MTGRTHDLAAFTALNFVFLSVPLTEMSLLTALTAFGANFVGGLFPDVDQPTSDFWDNFRGGTFISRYVTRFLGGHRHISHSLIGVALLGFLSQKLLGALQSTILIDMNIVWWSFMIGVISHIVFDMLTKEGVPLLWPLEWAFGLPPIKFLRMRSGYFVENMIVFPGLLVINILLVYGYQGKFLDFFHNYIK